MLHVEKSLPPFIKLGKALVMEKAGRVTSLLVRSRNTAGMMVVSPSAPLCGKEMSSHASLPLACGILFLAVLYILFSFFFAYFLFPIHYNTNISGL